MWSVICMILTRTKITTMLTSNIISIGKEEEEQEFLMLNAEWVGLRSSVLWNIFRPTWSNTWEVTNKLNRSELCCSSARCVELFPCDLWLRVIGYCDVVTSDSDSDVLLMRVIRYVIPFPSHHAFTWSTGRSPRSVILIPIQVWFDIVLKNIYWMTFKASVVIVSVLSASFLPVHFHIHSPNCGLIIMMKEMDSDLWVGSIMSYFLLFDSDVWNYSKHIIHHSQGWNPVIADDDN